jgi:hypothetical protein
MTIQDDTFLGTLVPILSKDTHCCSMIMSSDEENMRGKAVPLQDWSGPEGSRKLRFPDF